MKAVWIVLYIAVGLAEIYSEWSGNATLTYFSKPLLMPLLILYGISTGYKNPLHILALLFSLAGDAFLMFDGKLYFMSGLVSFLLAHLFYIFIFNKLRNPSSASPPYIGLILLILYALGLSVLTTSSLLKAGTADMIAPVLVYALVITLMGIFAFLRRRKTLNTSYLLVLTGALFFILSDSLIAVSTFVRPFDGSGVLIMITYLAAQFLILEGCRKHHPDKTDSNTSSGEIRYTSL